MIIKNLTIHMMIKNGEQYVRQTLMSTLPYVESAIIIDTGSTDRTKEYIKQISDKFPEKNILLDRQETQIDSINWNGQHLNQHLTDVRNFMQSRTLTDWVWQVDDDEIYSREAINDLRLAMDYLIMNPKARGIMVPIKWAVSDTQYVLPGPFPKTLRVFPKTGKWVGKFPDEFLYVDGHPIHINDWRCLTINNGFTHMSLATHPGRRPANGQIIDLSFAEQTSLQYNGF